MNIDNMTIGQFKELAKLFQPNHTSGLTTPHIGKRCIIRAYASGVFCGEVIAHEGRAVEVRNCRRLWSWKASDGLSLSSVAVIGVDPQKSKFPITVPEQTILDAIEIIPASETALKSIDATPIAQAS